MAEATRLLNTTQAALGYGDRPERGRRKLPLAIRNWDDLLALVPGRAGRPLHRAGRRHLVRPHRRRQRARHPLAAEQLPARRRRQQQHLDQRPGADDAGLAALGRRDPGVQGGDQPLLGRVRALAGRRDQRHHQVGHQPLPRHGLRLLPQRDASTRTTTSRSAAGQPRQADQRPEPVRRQPRRPDHQGQGVLLRRLRGHPHHPRRDAHHPRAHRRRARGDLHRHRPRSRSPASPSRATRIPAEPHRPRGRGRSWPSCPLPNQPGANNFFRQRRRDRQRRPHPRPRSTCARRSNDTVFARYIYIEPRPLRSPARSAASSTAPAPRPSATRRSSRTAWSRAGPASSAPSRRERVPLLVDRGRLRRGARRPFGQAPPRGATCPACPTTRSSPAASSASTIDGYFGGRPGPHRLAELPAEVPAHEPVGVPEHAVLAQGQPPVQVRRRHHGADEERVHGRARRRAATCASATASPATRSPTSCSATSSDAQLSNVFVVDQRHWATSFFVAGRLEA